MVLGPLVTGEVPLGSFRSAAVMGAWLGGGSSVEAHPRRLPAASPVGGAPRGHRRRETSGRREPPRRRRRAAPVSRTLVPVPTKVRNPRRVQARRDANYKAVHRPTRWGNPFPIDPKDPAARRRSLARYERWLAERLEEDPDFLEPLRGYRLGCFCAPELPCHADVILRALYGSG